MKESFRKYRFGFFFVIIIVLLLVNITSLKVISGFYNSNNTPIVEKNELIQNRPFFETNDFSPNEFNFSHISHLNPGYGDLPSTAFYEENYAYITNKDLYIYDVINVSSPILLSTYQNNFGLILDLTVRNRIIYLICQNLGVIILNATDFSSITELGKCGYFDNEIDLPKYLKSHIIDGRISNNIAYLVLGNGYWGGIGWSTVYNLFLIDLSDPAFPKPIDYFQKNNHRFRGIFVVGDRCYLQIEERGYGDSKHIQILDASNPNRIHSITIKRNMRLVCINDNNMAIVYKDDEYWLVDFTKARYPKFLSKLAMLPYRFYNLYYNPWRKEISSIAEDCVYSFDPERGNLSIININDRNNPISYSSFYLNNKVTSMEVFDDLLYIVGTKIQIFNITNPLEPVIIKEFQLSKEIFNYYDMFIENDRMYLLDATDKIIIKNLTDSHNDPEFVGQYSFNYQFNQSYNNHIEDVSFYVSKNYCYVIRNDFFEIINCTIPSKPICVWNKTLNFDYTRAETSILIYKNLLYLTLDDMIYIYNVTNPQNPNLLCEFTYDFYNPHLIANYYDNFLIVSQGYHTRIVNITDPLNPFVTTSIHEENRVSDIIIQNDLLCKLSSSIQIYNLTSPENPSLITSVGDDFIYQKFFLSNDSLYAYAGWFIDIYNLQDINNIKLVDSYNFINSRLEWRIFCSLEEPQHSVYSINDTIYTMASHIGLTVLGTDSDHDDIADYLEETLYHTNISLIDSDSDLMSDLYEVSFGLDPLSSDDKLADYDNDDLTNIEEAELLTNPFAKDTDSDNILDNVESLYGTNSTKWDTDHDGLSDGFEIYKANLNPLSVDTDNDEISDFHELVKYRFPPSAIFYLIGIPAIIIGSIIILVVSLRIMKKILKRKYESS